MGVKVCVYAICKDEAKEAAAWYANVEEADDVVVLDTGSTDGTPELLEKLGCPVFRREYDAFRFDVARNDALDLALEMSDADVFLTTDFDERLDAGWSKAVREQWDPGVHTRGVYDNWWEDSALPGSLNWMHDRTWMWLYPCHEVMTRRDGSGIHYSVDAELDFRKGKGPALHHHQDLTKSTRAQYLGLLKLRYEEDTEDQASLAYYLRELMYKAKPEEALGLESDARALHLEGNCGAWVAICLSWAHEVTGDKDAAMAWAYRGYSLDPSNRTAPVKLAQLLHGDGKPALALSVIEQAERTAPSYSDRNLFVDNPDVWTWRLLDWKGACLFALGHFDEALRCFEGAAVGAEGPDLEHVKRNIRAARAALGI